MTPNEADVILSGYESNLFADLYKSRWDAEYASRVVPNLIKCLDVDDKAILLRTLSAFNRIGPEACEAGPFVSRLLEHRDLMVREAAIYALTGVWFREGRRAVAPLVRMALDPTMLKPVMFGLISLGKAAKPAKEIFVAAFNHRDGRIRRLALRGLRDIGAEGSDVNAVLERAVTDKNSQVKAAAAKMILKIGHLAGSRRPTETRQTRR